jgi:hypothetical protein
VTFSIFALPSDQIASQRDALLRTIPVNLFRKSPEKKLQADLDAARNDCVTLTTRLSAAEQAVIERQAEARKLARENADEEALDTANGRVRKAQDRSATLAAALDEAKVAIGDLERQVAEQTDRKLRAESAAKAMKLADECEAAPADFDATVNDILEVASRAALIIHDAKGVQIFLGSARMEIRIALESVAKLLRSRASQILSGAAPAGLPKPAAPPAPKAAAPEMVTVFTIKPIRWQDQGNAAFTRRHPAFSQINLAPALAERAVVLNAAIAVNDPRVRTLSRGHAPVHAPLEHCINLDGDDQIETVATPQKFDDERVLHSAFVERRGSFLKSAKA